MQPPVNPFDFTTWLAAQPEAPGAPAEHAAFQSELADLGAGLAALAAGLHGQAGSR